MVRVHSSRLLKLELNTNRFQLLFFAILPTLEKKENRQRRKISLVIAYLRIQFIFIAGTHRFVSISAIE